MLQRIITRLKEDSTLLRIGHNVGWLTVSQVLSLALIIITSILSTHALGATNYGYYLLIVAFSDTINSIVDLRVWEILAQYIPRYLAEDSPEGAKAILKLSLWLKLFGGVTTFLGVALLAYGASGVLFKAQWLAPLFTIYGLTYILRAPVDTLGSLLRLSNRFPQLAIARLLNNFILLVLMVAASLEGLSLDLLIIIQFIIAVLYLAHLLVFVIPAVRELKLQGWWRASLRVLSPERANIRRFVLSLYVSSQVNLSYQRPELLILGVVGTPTEVGLYGLARRVWSELYQISLQVFDTVHTEVARQIANHDADAVSRLSRQVTLLSAAVGFIGFILMLFLAPIFVPLLYGSSFTGAVPLIQIIGFSLIFLATTWAVSFLYVTQHSQQVALVDFLSMVGLIILGFILTYYFRGIGAAIAFTLVMTFRSLSLVILGNHVKKGWIERN